MYEWLMFQVEGNGWTLEQVAEFAAETINDLRDQVKELGGEPR